MLFDIFKEVSSTSADIDEKDIIKTKNKLKDLNYYDEPEFGITEIPDKQMIDGIKSFQKDNNLKIDGIMKPGGETVQKINELDKIKNDINYIKSEAKRITPLKISDENKHQYISCLAGERGALMTSLTLGYGMLKEGKDIYKKMNSPRDVKNYGGKINILKDSVKDINNNIKGASYGVSNNNPNCKDLLINKL